MNDSTSHGQVLRIGDKPIELRLVALSPLMLRITAVPLRAGDSPEPVPSAPEIIVHETGSVIATIRGLAGDRTFEWGGNRVRVSADPLRIVIADAAGRTCQDLRIAPDGRIDFSLGDGALFGLGQGGRQFDRRGGLFERINGQGEGVRSIDMNAPGSRAPEYAFDLAGEGARITIPWLISVDGWASYFHLPQGTFDLTGTRGQLIPEQADAFVDAFLVVSRDPAEIMRQYALLTGFSHLPPLWSLGYLQSHRTLASRDEVLAEVAEFRKRRLPCDGMIYLGTGFCPDGWNTGHDSFAFNPRIFPDPHAMLRQLHDDGMRVIVHVVDPPLHLNGVVDEPSADPSHVAHYWARHLPAVAAGVDGWWPDVGDRLDPRRAARAHPHVLGRPACDPSGPASVRAAPQRLCGSAALRLALVGRHRLGLAHARHAGAGRTQLRPHRHRAVGDRHRRLHHHAGADRRALRALVPVQRVLPAVSQPRPHLEAAPALGLEHRRVRARGIRLSPRRAAGSERTAQSGRRADLSQISRAALPAAALHLFGGARDAPTPACR